MPATDNVEEFNQWLWDNNGQEYSGEAFVT